MWPFKKKQNKVPERSLTDMIFQNPSILTSINPDPKVESLINQLRSDDWRKRLNAVRSLGSIFPPNIKAIVALSTIAKVDGNETIRHEAEKCLRDAGIDANDTMSYVEDAMKKRRRNNYKTGLTNRSS